MNDNMPVLVSVLMTTLNSERFIAEAIESVLHQTLTQFELIVLDGGSTDRTVEIARSIQDPRIQVLLFPGLHRGARLNHGVERAKAEIITMMDSDDIAHPTRFQRQYDVLTGEGAISVTGTWAQLIDEAGQPMGTLKRPLRHDEIAHQLFAMNGICWPTCSWKKVLWTGGNHFHSVIRRFEDIDWYAHIEPVARFANLPEPLMKLRQTKNSLGRVSSNHDRSLLFNAVYDTMKEQFSTAQTTTRRADVERNIGICSYYYGERSTTIRLLSASFMRRPFSLLTLRYLLVALFVPAGLLGRLRSMKAFRMLAASLRIVSVMASVAVSKVKK